MDVTRLRCIFLGGGGVTEGSCFNLFQTSAYEEEEEEVVEVFDERVGILAEGDAEVSAGFFMETAVEEAAVAGIGAAAVAVAVAGVVVVFVVVVVVSVEDRAGANGLPTALLLSFAEVEAEEEAEEEVEEEVEEEIVLVMLLLPQVDFTSPSS